MKFLLKFPSRGRPEKFKSTLKKHLENLSNKNKYKFVFSFDVDDLGMNDPEIFDYIKSLDIEFEIFYGPNRNKIEAINANLENQEFDVLVLISDDMIPLVKDYDEIIREIIEKSKNGLDSTIHFHTSRWSDLLDIWCIMGRDYYNRFGYIYHPDYKSIFCDNEYTEVSNILGKRIFSEISLFYHDHISSDETDNKNWQFNSEDWVVYDNRKKNFYGLSLQSNNSK